MAKVILTVSYEINPEKRSEYLEFMKGTKEKSLKQTNYTYSLYELIGKKNWFSEVYIFNSKEDYDNFEEVEEDQMGDPTEFLKDGKMKFSQMLEIM